MAVKCAGITPKCKVCGQRKLIGNTNGVPNMIGFQLKTGKTINICSKCLIKVNDMTEAETDKFFEDIQK